MAEFTKLDDGAVAAIADMFDIGAVAAWKPIAAGTINSNFVIDTAQGRFFLRVNEGKSAEDVAYETALVEALIERGVATPMPLARTGGTRYAAWGDQYVHLFPWVDGHHRHLGEVTTDDAHAVGSVLAALHAAGAPLVQQFTRGGIYTFDHITDRLAQITARHDPYLDPYVASLTEEVDWLMERAELRGAADRGIIHGDLFRDNVLFEATGTPVLLDFEQASVGSLVYDLAVCVNAWCFVESFDPPLVRAMVAGYRAGRALTEPDRAALYCELRAAAMRFTVTRITDIYLPGLDVPGKEFQRYFRRLEAWRAMGAAGVDALIA